jgi:hypothetical protein
VLQRSVFSKVDGEKCKNIITADRKGVLLPVVTWGIPRLQLVLVQLFNWFTRKQSTQTKSDFPTVQVRCTCPSSLPPPMAVVLLVRTWPVSESGVKCSHRSGATGGKSTHPTVQSGLLPVVDTLLTPVLESLLVMWDYCSSSAKSNTGTW